MSNLKIYEVIFDWTHHGKYPERRNMELFVSYNERTIKKHLKDSYYKCWVVSISVLHKKNVNVIL